MVLLVALVPVVVADLRWRIVPDLVVVPALVCVCVLGAVASDGPWWRAPVAAGVTGGLLLVPALVRPDGMGMGDVKLAALIGAALGVVAGLVAVLAGLVAAAAWGYGAAIRRRAAPSAVALPLAPFLAVGVVAVVGPSWFVDSARAADPGHRPPAATAVRPAAVGGWVGGRNAALARERAGHRPRHAGGGRACGGAPAR